jgi:uncharacterized protein
MAKVISLFLFVVLGTSVAAFAGEEDDLRRTVNEGVALLKAQKYEQSKPYFETACRKEMAEGCFNLGAALLAGGDTSGAKSAYEKACSLSKWACAGLAALEYRAGNIEKSKDLYEVGCTAGNAQACTDLAYLKPESERQTLYQKGCNGESMEGCNNLAFIIEKEKPTEAFLLYKKACAAEYIDACNNLAFMCYKKGSLSQALDLYKHACQKGQSQACGSIPKIEQALSSN